MKTNFRPFALTALVCFAAVVLFTIDVAPGVRAAVARNAGLSNSLPAPTFPPGRAPTDDDTFERSVTLRSGLKGTLLEEGEIPIGRWEFVSYIVFPDSFSNRRKYPPVLKMSFPKRFLTQVVFTYSNTFLGASSFQGPWYRSENGCLETFWPYEVASNGTSPFPWGSESWIANEMAGKVCGFLRSGNTLTIPIALQPRGSVESALSAFVLRRVPEPKKR
jgi:hypothetical protein